MFQTLETLTPETAEHLLTTTDQPVQVDRVAELVQAIERGRWDPELHKQRPMRIKETPYGYRLSNGHHRTHAVVITGVSVTVWIVGWELLGGQPCQ